MKFDPSMARERVAKMWKLPAKFGTELNAYSVYLNEWVSDRYALINGMQLLRDELQFATGTADEDIFACGAELGVPSVVTTLAHTNCGDRIHQGEATTSYEHTVAARFATLSEIGELKLEAFSPTGGGTDDGATLAHVTVAHQLDEPLRAKIYGGNDKSFVLVNIDLKTHVGRMDHDESSVYGRTQESPWRIARASCGGVVGALSAYNEENNVHRRIRSDLGEANYEFLKNNRIISEGGTDVTAAVASAIVAIQGMRNTAEALTTELDERGVGHLTASVTVNRVSQDDPVIYLARATVFNGELSFQGFGTDATKFSAKMVRKGTDRRLKLIYAGTDVDRFPVVTRAYEPRLWRPSVTAPALSLD
jgi:hypothetical protein